MRSVNNIRTKLMLTSIIGLALPILILTIVSNVTTENYSNYESLEKFDLSKKSILYNLDQKNEEMANFLKYLSENENIKSYFIENNFNSLNIESENIKSSLGVDEVIFLDEYENVITENELNNNFDFKNLNSGYLVITNGNLNQFSVIQVQNIYKNQELVGSVVIIDYLDENEFVNNLKDFSNFDVSLYMNGMIVSTTLADKAKLSHISSFFENSASESEYESFLESGNDYLIMDDAGGNLLGYLIISAPKSTALSYLNAARSHNLIVAFFGFVVSIVVSLISSRNLTKPITKLKNGAEQFSKGVYDHNIDVNTGDELEDLADSFNKMANSIMTLNDLIDTDRKTMAKTLRELSDFMYEMSRGNLSVRLDENQDKNRLQKNVNQAINNFSQLLKSVQSEVSVLDQQTINLNKELTTTMNISGGG
ncbi:histidine kinase, HAMP region domain protein [Methanococcus maripaludis C5]|uniref:histidine kinase n=1 Tax=Methanococcus maripaludis (strain C5 / ATCC BAA-1333) TaxID=402880 RepID=A4FZ89_METM5|nr:HAMP domain-containing protein [Methanococcus maripaludis]ABO35523.1 histidine kinase, HAMP region domain protein [Methanococcus maripaludis C5]